MIQVTSSYHFYFMLKLLEILEEEEDRNSEFLIGNNCEEVKKLIQLMVDKTRENHFVRYFYSL